MAQNKSFEAAHDLTAMELDTLTLKASIDIINDMVNFAVMKFHHKTEGSIVYFKSEIHKAYFNILLVDFLSKPKGFFESSNTYLERLAGIVRNPNYYGNDIGELANAVDSFDLWLKGKITINDMWFPSLDTNGSLEISRQDFIVMTGNMSKHNFTQQTFQAKRLKKIMRENNYNVSLDESLLALPDFYERFHDDIFSYYSSILAKFLNNLRWGIFKYANAERCNSVRTWQDETIHSINYKYIYPESVKSKLGQYFYWELMNDVRNQPYVPKFDVDIGFEEHY